MKAVTRPIGPRDLPAAELIVADCRGDRLTPVHDLPSLFVRAPNVGLLWHRYMPDHSLKKGTYESPFGEDFREFAEAARRASLKISDVGEQISRWAGLGALSWFVAAAHAAQKHIAAGPSSLLTRVAARRKVVLAVHGDYWEFDVQAPWRVAIGLGNTATFEHSGCSWEHTYGFPILPASGLKGLARHYLEQQLPLEGSDRTVLNPLAAVCSPDTASELLFGTATANASADDEDVPSRADDAPITNDPGSEGVVAFHDAWPTGPSDQPWFDVDVLTVHHQEYYAGKRPAADDCEGPNPVHFLTLRPGITFDIPLSITGAGRRRLATAEQRATALRVTELILRRAFQEWGVGAKTGAGYGRLQRPQAVRPTPLGTKRPKFK